MGGRFVDRKAAAVEVAGPETEAAEVAEVEPLALVTGATGFIGSRLVDTLAARQPVRALVLPGESLDRAGVDVAVGDVRDRAALRRACRGVDVVYHLAAKVGDWGSEEEFRSINVDGTRNLLDAAVAAGCRRIVMVSSIAVYGWHLHTDRCDEDIEHGEGVSPYARTKSASEQLARDYGRRHDIEVVVVRPGNVYGPGVSPWVGLLADYLRQGRVPLVDGGRGDAGMVYVDNVVDALVESGRRPQAAGRVYNVADGHGVTWKRYLTDLAELAGAKPPRLSVPHRVLLTAARALERIATLRKRSQRPLFTREAVTLLSSRQPIPIARAQADLGYQPRPYRECLAAVSQYLRASNAGSG